MKYSQAATAIAASALLAFVVAAQQNQSNRLKKSDQTFVMKALQGGMAEVELGNVAVQKGSNDKVKQFGQQMVDDHTKAGDELKAIATKKGITPPSTIDAKSQATKKRLTGLSGAVFDRTYMQDMVTDHKEDIAEFEKEANSGSDPEVKDFASKTLPTLRHHLQMAEDALAAVK